MLTRPVLLLLLLLLFCCVFGKATAQTHIDFKANAFTSVLLMPNAGVEWGVGGQWAAQLDVAASFWNSYNGSPLQFIQVFPEARRYFGEANTGFFVGAHLGFGMFTLTKNRFPFSTSNRKYPKGTYQTGRNTYYGMTMGYKYFFNDHWGLELFLGGGSSQSHYKGYNAQGERTDNIDNTNPDQPVITTNGFNKSGEWLPYRGGVMLVWRI